jgi:hypothetical protein
MRAKPTTCSAVPVLLPFGVAWKRDKVHRRANFDAFEEQLREMGTPNWIAYDLRVMFQAYVERGPQHPRRTSLSLLNFLGMNRGRTESMHTAVGREIDGPGGVEPYAWPDVSLGPDKTA